MMPSGDHLLGRENRTDRFELLKHWGPPRQSGERAELYALWDKQKRTYITSSRDAAELADLRDLLNERDRKDWDYGNPPVGLPS